MLKPASRTAAALAVLATLGGAQAARAQRPVSWWYGRGSNPQQQRALERNLVTPFDKAHPDHPLHIEFRGSVVDRQIRIALLSGGGPDIVMTPGPSYVVPLEEGGELLPLDAYAARYGWNAKLLPEIVRIGTFKGHLYALPRTDETMAVFYDTSLFAKYGWTAPKTLADLQKLAAAMMARGITPFGAGNADWRGANEWYVTLVLNHYAGPQNVYKALTGKLPWTAPVFVQAIALLKDWYAKGWFGKNYFALTNEQGFAGIADGKAGMSPNGFWAFQWVPAHFAANGSDLGVSPFPTLRDGVPYPVFSVGVGSTLSINKNARDPDAAAAVLDAMFNPGFYQKINKDWPGDWNLPLASVDQAELSKDATPQFAGIVHDLTEAIKQGDYGYATWAFWPPATEQYLISGIEQVWLGQVTPAAYMTQIDTLFREESKQGKVPPIPAR